MFKGLTKIKFFSYQTFCLFLYGFNQKWRIYGWLLLPQTEKCVKIRYFSRNMTGHVENLL